MFKLKALILMAISGSTSLQASIQLSNDDYTLDVNTESITITRSEQQAKSTLKPELTLFYSAEKLQYERFHTHNGRAPVASWDGRSNVWESADHEKLVAIAMEHESDRSITFKMEESPVAVTRLNILLPDGKSAPVFTWTITPKTSGYFSAGFTGIQEKKPDELDFLYQPLVWTWKRFPDEAILTPEAFATTAASFINSNEITEGLHVDQKEIPFRYANIENSRFGIALRTENALARPTIFAPILGGIDSKMETSESYSFSVKYFMQQGDWQIGTQYLYKEVIGYRKERENFSVSLNETLDNMIDFAMDDEYSGWITEWKGSDYSQDAPDTVKNVSALHPMSVALTRGSSEIYRKRGLPMTEYMMSRQKYLFTTDPSIKTQSPSIYLKGPTAEIGELSGLYKITNFQNEAFAAEINRLFGQPRMLNLTTATISDSWQDYLARYKIKQDPKLLTEAKRLADEYIENHVDIMPNDFSSTPGLKDRKAYFVTDFGILWYDLFELYEATGEQRYLDAAELGAMQMLLWIRSSPFGASGATHVYNEENVSVMNSMDAQNRIERAQVTQPDEIDNFQTEIPLERQEVPQWQASFVGLIPESSYTYFLGSIMLTHHAAWMLRLAHHTENELLAETAYNTTLGRYANYPGYYVRSKDSNIYQRGDYPMKRFKDVRYNNMFYNHVWPQIALVQDFIVSDAYYRSEGNVNFPSVYAPGYAFLQSKVYGHAPGNVYDNEGVRLWLPEGALISTEVTLNHVFGRDDENTYVVLMNTSDESVQTSVRFNPDQVPWDYGRTYSVVYYDKVGNKTKGTMLNGKLSVNVPANSIQSVKINGLQVVIEFQIDHLNEQSPVGKEVNDFFRLEHDNPALGTITGMRLRLAGKDSAYVFSSATFNETSKVGISFKVGNYEWEHIEDSSYPYEFSLPIYAPEAPVLIKWSALDPNTGEMVETEVFELKD